MKLGIMQPYFMPYIGYWQLMNAVDLYVVYDDVNYIKGGWINRNRILVNNTPSYFNLPLINASPNKKINEIEIDTDSNIFNKNIKTIELSYKKAPYYDEIYPLIKRILLYKEKSLPKFILNSFNIISEYLNINTEFVLSSNLIKNNELRAQDKVIDICKNLNANEYYNAIGGMELYDKDLFEQSGIKLSFLNTNKIKYKQYNNDFISNLSIIDVLMFNSKQEVKNMLKMYNLI